jgi:hypothetical protein
MTKDEALALALEALEYHTAQTRPITQTQQAITAIKQALAAQAAPVQDIPDLIAGALGVSRGTAYDLMREALKEAAQQEPVTQTFGEENVELGFYSNATGTGQQRELVGEVEMGQLVGDGPHKSAGNPDAEGAVAVIEDVDEYGPMLGWYKHWINFPVGTLLYTTPPASQEEIQRLSALVRAQQITIEKLEAQPEQEPVCQYAADVDMPEHRCVGKCQYAAQRQWVPLTNDERRALEYAPQGVKRTPIEMSFAIEAKLREKNA